ncbi:MAG: hypothetical protein ACEPO2_19350 [Pelagibaca sp.]
MMIKTPSRAAPSLRQVLHRDKARHDGIADSLRRSQANFGMWRKSEQQKTAYGSMPDQYVTPRTRRTTLLQRVTVTANGRNSDIAKLP